MATPKKTTKKVSSTRLYVNVAPQNNETSGQNRGQYGVTRSSLISMILGQYCESTERAFEAIPDAMKTALAMAAQSPRYANTCVMADLVSCENEGPDRVNYAREPANRAL